MCFILQVSKDDRSDVESSSDGEGSVCDQTRRSTIKPKDTSHTGNLNGEAHDH